MRAFGLIVFLCVSLTGLSQQYVLRNYKAVDGLPQSQVNMVVEDKLGYLWVATHGGGLARFDGKDFKVYTTLDGLLSNIVTFLKIDNEQNLWIVHSRGITKFDGKTFTKFQQPGKPSNIRRIRKIFQHADTMFFISPPGLLGKIYKDSVYYWAKPVVRNKNIAYSHLLPSKETMLYLSDSSFVVLGENGRRHFNHKTHFNRLYTIFNYKSETWILTDSGYYKLNADNLTFEKRDLAIQNSILFYDSVQDVFWTRRDNFLLKEKIEKGIHKVDTVLREESVMQILPDYEGNTWLATYGNGLYKYFVQDFNKCSSKNMRAVMAVLKEDDGTCWIGTGHHGLIKMKDGKTSHYFYDKKDEQKNAILAIDKGPDGSVWVSTSYGLGKYNKRSDEFEIFTSNEGLSSSSISGIEFDDRGNAWIGTFSGGLNYFDGNSFKHYSLKHGLASVNILSLHFLKQNKTLYMGSEFGLSSLSKGVIVQEPLQEIENTSVLSINPFRDSLLLIGTAGAGVMVYNPITKKKSQITTREGLVSDFVYFSAADPEGQIWIGTEKGITKILLDNDLNIIRNLHYDHDNGLEGIEANQNAFFLGKDEKYFGMIDGLYEYTEAGYDPTHSFNLQITEVNLLFGEEDVRRYTKGLDGFFKIPVGLSLPPNQNHIRFTFNRVDKRYPKSIKFRYRLVNYDKTWSMPSAQHEVTYSNLSPGEYVFEVMATDNKGSWANEPTRYAFVIEAPFYQTAGFIASMIVLIIGAVLLILFLRVRYKVNKAMEVERIRTQEQEMLRKEIARDFHDEMGNQLSRIINYVSLLRLNGKSGMSQNDLFTKVEGSAKYLYSGTRDFIWSIDPVNDELSKLFIHLRDFGEKLFEEKSIHFRAYNEVREKVTLPYGFSRQANLIFKEAMTNAFKYSDAQNVQLTLKKEGELFTMAFEDDGKGFLISDIATNGLQNIRDRASRINSTLRIQSKRLGTEPNSGTSIVLEFKNTKASKHGTTV